MVPVKVFNTEVEDAYKMFDLECEVLRNIRHRNLVKVISSCANLAFKALVRSTCQIETSMHGFTLTTIFLDLIQRLKVMIEVAFAMEYLHEGHSFVVVHCDLKPEYRSEGLVLTVGDVTGYSYSILLMEIFTSAYDLLVGEVNLKR
uniref:Probable LRR receptor-like serine/threonine-protein kinase At3g47570 n=1 Tax=Nicotiana sylvestris TaxID=4096 RepID=A0A1U7W825_NICSY|nr:PREDICTED: probable LRR receptor-like serine/threonine-protein kinase At3g47570 [Nicotiana sylvestris]